MSPWITLFGKLPVAGSGQEQNSGLRIELKRSPILVSKMQTSLDEEADVIAALM
jgi:hypothetical protein